MAYEAILIEVMDSTVIALSDGVKTGVEKWGEEPIKDFVKSLFLRGVILAGGSSIAGSFALMLGRALMNRWRALAEKAPDPRIVRGIIRAEAVLRDYGDLLDGSKESRETQIFMFRHGLDHLFDAYILACELKEEHLAQRIEFLMGLFGLMLGDVHTRMLRLDPFIKEPSRGNCGSRPKGLMGLRCIQNCHQLKRLWWTSLS